MFMLPVHSGFIPFFRIAFLIGGCLPAVSSCDIISHGEPTILGIAFFPLAFTALRSRIWIRVFLVLTFALSTLGAVLTITFVAMGQHGVAALGPGFAQAALEPGTIYFDPSGQSVGWMPLQVVSGV